MPWYKTGTIAATNGSKIITGTGTQFTNPLNGVSAGRMLLLPAAGAVQIYEIESVQSDTQLTLVSAFTGTTGSGKAYAIPASPAISIEQFAHEFASTLAYYQQQLSGWQQILTGTGNVTLTTPDGQTVTVRSQRAWDAALNRKVTGVKQTGPFDATANSLLINGAHGLGGVGVNLNLNAANFLTWARTVANGSTFFRNLAGNIYTKQYGSGIFSRTGDTWAAISCGYSASNDTNINGVRVVAGNNTDAVNVYELWTDQNLANPATLDTAQTISGSKKFTQNVAVENTYPAITLSSTRQSLGTVGRMVRLEHDGLTNQPYFVRSDGNGSTGQVVLRFPMAATGVALVSGNNAVADSNGFYKTASPVVNLFADGTSELTSEAEGITTERLSEGVYRISGCLGLNADRAWGGDDGGIDVPMCRNKLPRLWVDYGGDDGGEQINPDGSIIIRTYHRPHPDAPVFARNEIEGYANGDPIDIPRDTFISVRVQMPEREEPKPQVIHSNVYYNTVARAKRKSRAARK